MQPQDTPQQPVQPVSEDPAVASTDSAAPVASSQPPVTSASEGDSSGLPSEQTGQVTGAEGAGETALGQTVEGPAAPDTSAQTPPDTDSTNPQP